MSTDDRSLPPELVQRLQAVRIRREAAAARCSRRGPEAAVGDVYTLPMPVPGPSVWCVVGMGGDLVDLVPVDQRPFFDAQDLWVDASGDDVGLRRGALAKVLSGSLRVAWRTGVLEGLPAALAQAEAPLADGADPIEAEWRWCLQRAARLLPTWLAQRTLALGFADLRDESDFDAGHAGLRAAAPAPPVQRPARLAAKSSGLAALYECVALARDLGLSWEEIDCAGGRLVLVASHAGLGFLFEPEPGAEPPPLLWIHPSTRAGEMAQWEAGEGGRAFRTWRSQHWLQGKAEVEIQVASPFRIQFDPAGGSG